jgi:hypothetical protein
MESIFSSPIIIFIAVAFFIVRIVLSAKNQAKGPKYTALRPPVAVDADESDDAEEDDDEVDDDYAPFPQGAADTRMVGIAETISHSVMETYGPDAAGQNADGQAPGANFAQKLGQLSPLKQAVIWSEILGPPRGLEPPN